MPRYPRVLAAVVLPVLLALGPGLVAAPAAQAAERTVAGGRLDWGIKESFLRYVTGPVARGRWTLLDGAASGFRFHSAEGGYDPETGELTAAFTGGVRFVGHEKDGAYRLDMTLRRFTVRIAGGTGTLHADVTSKDRHTGRTSTADQAALATLDLGGVDMRGGGSPVALSGVPATLTAAGEKAFAGYYPAGTRLDPVSLSVDVQAPSATGKPERKPDSEPSAEKKERRRGGDGRIVDGAVDWGVRRTFRDYVTGPVAEGRWRLSDGARDGGALFRFGRGKGSYDAEKQRLDATFAGTLHFTGADLDLALGGVAVTVEDGEGTLSADVTDNGDVAENVPLVAFPAGRMKAEDGLVAVTEAPAELTARGARAFGGLYPAGTAMDPVSVAVALDADAELPALPDLGSDPTAAPTPTSGPGEDEGSRPETSGEKAAGSSSPAVPLAVGSVALLLAVAAAYAVARRRRRGPVAATAATDAATIETTDTTDTAD